MYIKKKDATLANTSSAANYTINWQLQLQLQFKMAIENTSGSGIGNRNGLGIVS